jgi:hypothetical protein
MFTGDRQRIALRGPDGLQDWLLKKAKLQKGDGGAALLGMVMAVQIQISHAVMQQRFLDESLFYAEIVRIDEFVYELVVHAPRPMFPNRPNPIIKFEVLTETDPVMPYLGEKITSIQYVR